MKTTQDLNRLELRLLVMLRPMEMLRFVFGQTNDGRITVTLEGSSDSAAGLMQRISTILRASRSEGFVFNQGFCTSHSTTEVLPSRAGNRVVEIVPDAITICRFAKTPLGFTERNQGLNLTGNGLLEIPDFPISGGQRLVDHPATLMLESSAIRGVEIEFTRTVVDEACAGLLASALEEDIFLRRAIHGVEIPATPVSSFLALWYSRRAGWLVNCRVNLKQGHPIPTGTLEVLGREIFGSECRIVEGETPNKGLSSSIFSLAQSYPDGWPFPALLPPIADSGSLVAERIHNLQPPTLSPRGILAGMADGKKVLLPTAARDRHIYIAGATGTGKSTLLRRLLRADLKRKEGLVLLDPHGDLYREVLALIPKSRRDDVVVIDPTSDKAVVGFNVLDFPKDEFLKRRAEFLVGELIRFFRETWDTPEAFGPIFETYFRNALRLLIHQESQTLTLMDFERVFADKDFRQGLLGSCTDSSIRTFWVDVAEKTGGEMSLANMAPYITSKISVLTQSSFISEMIGQPKDELRLEERLNRGGIILVNLNKGLLGANESRLLGVLLTMQIFAAGLKRSTLPMRERRPVNVYIDEFQNFVSDNIASMLSEARKFGLRMNLANQTLCQLKSGRGRQDLLETVLGNVGTMIAFRLGVPDAERLRPFLKPFMPEQIQDLPNFHAFVRLLDENGPIGPFIMKTLK